MTLESRVLIVRRNSYFFQRLAVLLFQFVSKDSARGAGLHRIICIVGIIKHHAERWLFLGTGADSRLYRFRRRLLLLYHPGRLYLSQPGRLRLNLRPSLEQLERLLILLLVPTWAALRYLGRHIQLGTLSQQIDRNSDVIGLEILNYLSPLLLAAA